MHLREKFLRLRVLLGLVPALPIALHVDERLAQLEPANPLVFYNLACSYSLTGEFDRALASLYQAIDLGYRDFSWLARDPDLKPLRAQPGYQELKIKIRQLKKSDR